MHDELFEQPAVVARYRAGPYAESRERFLRGARADGYSPATLESMAWALLVVAEAVHRDGGSISYQRLRSTLLRRIRLKSTARPPSANTAKLFLRCAKAWLRSTGALTPEAERPLKFAAELRAFTRYMQFEQGLSPTTIAGRDEQMRWFCASLPSRVRSLGAVTLADVDAFLTAQAQRGWSRRSLHTLGGSLRSFFRYAASQGWCRSDLASSIELPCLYALEDVPRAPSVEAVGRLLEDTASSDDPVNIRDYAILSLLIYYGLRRGEVERLTLDDLDWVAETTLRDIRPHMVSRFVEGDGTSDETKHKKYRAVSGLFRFAVTRRLLKASPLPQPPRMRCYSSYAAYIYSEAELKQLLAAVPTATASPRCVIDADTLRTLLLLLYGAALRRGEALRLKLGDVDVPQSLIHIRGTKFFKTRIVPLGSSLNAVMREFVARRVSRHSEDSESTLFTKRNGAPLSDSTICHTFRRLCAIAGIRRDGGARNQPRMHDLRHSAAVHRVIAWYRCDADLNDLLPKLATYLGHSDLSGTQRYLTMTQELLAEASRRFEAFAGRSRQGSGLGVSRPVGLERDLRHFAAVGPAGRDAFGAFGRSAMQQHHVGVLGVDLVEPVPDRVVIVEVDPAREGNLGAGREQRLGLGAALGGEEIAAVDHGRGQRAVVDHRAGARPPG